MPTSYTSLLGLALPVTGELSGTWGDTVNDYITQYLDASVAGTQTISGSQTAVTLSKTTATSLSQAGSGATGSSQYFIINCTGNPAGLLTITAPAASKPYIVINGTSTSQSVKIVGAGPTTGVTLVSGEKAVVAWNGSDFTKVASTVITNLTGTLPVANGGTGATTLTANNVILGNGTSAIQFVAPGTSGNVLTSNGTTWTSAVLPAGGLTYIYTTTGVTATDKQGVLADTSGGSFTVTLPATPSTGAQVVVADAGASWGTNNLTVGRNGSTIGGLAENLVCDITGASVQFVYDGSTWEVYAQVGGNGGNVATQPGNNTFSGTNSFSGTTSFTNTATFTGSSSAIAMVLNDAAETTTVSATAATGTINYDVTTQSVLYYTTNASANWTVNFRGSSGTSMNSLMSTGQSVTVAFLVTQGSTAYYNSAVQIDGSSVTPKYQGGTAWSAGNASGIDAYVYTIIKTGSATFTVLASQTQFK
jgi:hypothetical protein